MKKFFPLPEKLPQVKEMSGIGPVQFVASQRARRINITVKVNGAIRVAVPRRVRLRTAEEFVLSKREWIKRQLTRAGEKQAAAAEYSDRLNELDKTRAKNTISIRLQELAEEFGFSYNRLTIRNQKTRWGSCSAKNNISLNVRLALLPEELRDLILVHELIHTRIKNHGPLFWQKLESIYPNARELDRKVNSLGGLLRECTGRS